MRRRKEFTFHEAMEMVLLLMCASEDAIAFTQMDGVLHWGSGALGLHKRTEGRRREYPDILQRNVCRQALP